MCFYISAEELAWVNNEIIGRQAAAKRKEEDHKDDDSGSTGDSAQYRYEAEGNQQSDNPCLRPVYEPAEEAPASFAPLFQLDAKFDLEPLGKTDFALA